MVKLDKRKVIFGMGCVRRIDVREVENEMKKTVQYTKLIIVIFLE